MRIKRNKSLSFDLSVKQIEYVYHNNKKFFYGGLLQEAAQHVHEEAMKVMRAKYFATSKKGSYKEKSNRKNKPLRKQLEYRLFGKNKKFYYKSGDSVEVNLLPDFDQIVKELPHLLFQEYGTSGNIDKQGFIRRGGKYYNIKKTQYRGSQGRFIPRAKKGKLVFLNVPHPPIKKRGFILAANRWLKEQGPASFYLYLSLKHKQFIEGA